MSKIFRSKRLGKALGALTLLYALLPALCASFCTFDAWCPDLAMQARTSEAKPATCCPNSDPGGLELAESVKQESCCEWIAERQEPPQIVASNALPAFDLGLPAPVVDVRQLRTIPNAVVVVDRDSRAPPGPSADAPNSRAPPIA